MSAEIKNPFDLLGLPARPMLDGDLVRRSFRERAAAGHPDAGGDDGAHATLAAARDILLDDTRRVRALASLHGVESGSRRAAIPPALADAGFQAEPALKTASDLLRRHGADPGLLTVAMLTDERIRASESLLACQAALERMGQSARATLMAADHDWAAAGGDKRARDAALRLALEAADELAYLRRWISQVAEHLHQLAVLDAMIPG